MSFLIKPYDGHVGVCILNRTTAGASNTWTIQGGTFTPTINADDTVSLQGGFRYFITWNWAFSNTTTAFLQRTLSATRTTDLSTIGSMLLSSRPRSSSNVVQATEATIVFDSPCDSYVNTLNPSYECPSSSLLIWRFPL
jgi:hypothetical protein